MASTTTSNNINTNHTYTASDAIIAPSILSADFANLGSDCNRMIELGADWLHIDIMDGHFVPNLTIGPAVVQSLRNACPGIYFDCHLMVTNPEQWITAFAAAGANGYTFHIEATDKPTELIQSIKSAGMRAGITLRPSTSIESILPYLSIVDLVLIMTVEPGFGGQSFMPDQMDKVKLIRSKYPNLLIEVDGGVSPDTIDQCAAAGSNVIVAGSAIFKAKEPGNVIKILKQSVQKYIDINRNNQSNSK